MGFHSVGFSHADCVTWRGGVPIDGAAHAVILQQPSAVTLSIILHQAMLHKHPSRHFILADVV